MLKDWIEVKTYLKDQIDSSEDSPSELMGKAGLSKDSYYKLFAPERLSSPMRKSTVHGIAAALSLDVSYEYGIPQFIREDTNFESIPISNAREALETLLLWEGPIESIAEKSKVPVEDILNILNSTSKHPDIPLDFLLKISTSLKMKLTVWENGFVSFDHTNSDKIDKPWLVPLLWHEGIAGVIHEIVDEGLQELVGGSSSEFHKITESEITELARIAENRQSNGSLNQWVSILYSIRSLDTIDQNEGDVT